MGIANRDYFRQPPSSGGFFGWSPGTAIVCKRLILANVIVFLLQIFVTRPMVPADLGSRFGDRGEKQRKALEEALESMGQARVSIVEEWCQLDTAKVLHGQICAC